MCICVYKYYLYMHYEGFLVYVRNRTETPKRCSVRWGGYLIYQDVTLDVSSWTCITPPNLPGCEFMLFPPGKDDIDTSTENLCFELTDNETGAMHKIHFIRDSAFDQEPPHNPMDAKCMEI